MCGFPCQIFSTMNPSKWGSDFATLAMDPGFHAVKGMIEHLRVRQPRICIIENVNGLVKKRSTKRSSRCAARPACTK